MKDSSLQSRTIEWLRFLCAFFVILIHELVNIAGDAGNVCWRNGIFDTVGIFVSEGVCTVAVPVFFIISGYLFFSGLSVWRRSVWLSKLRKRIRTLFAPYMIWNILPFVIIMAASYCGWVQYPLYFKPYFQDNGLVHLFWAGHNGHPFNYPLWFVRNLIVLDLISPAIYLIVKKTGPVGLIILYLAYLLKVPDPFSGFWTGMFFFSSGAYLKLHCKDMSSVCVKYCKPAILLSCCLLAGMVLSYGCHNVHYDYLQRTYALTGSASLIGIVTVLMSRSVLKDHPLLSDSSFFVYAVHGNILLPGVNKAISFCIPGNMQIMLLLRYILSASIAFFIAVALFYWMRKTLPGFLSVLVGGR